MTHVLVMGVCGTGKSSVASRLADRLGTQFIEADSYHSASAVARMSRGEPLTDADRWSWLDRIAEAAREAGGDTVIACSALKRSYRDRLAAALEDLRIVHLSGSRSLVAERMAGRKDHFMPASLIDSQFALLEAPDGEDVLTIDIARPVQEIVDAAETFATRTRPLA
ncbi:gluconate kinase, SKI family [Roseivivax lentus]|uniref:Gluconokinase n=1 Tax=Roseivivax lentus TaxID=633194 RepID=A0A1N7NFI0_9RHOB|nr:gluconokinase [Roseivivax lentus]SIS97124.1 gluconate kinase, SKI family [Roseivivax lentus]